jgi:hypothetical protein
MPLPSHGHHAYHAAQSFQEVFFTVLISRNLTFLFWMWMRNLNFGKVAPLRSHFDVSAFPSFCAIMVLWQKVLQFYHLLQWEQDVILIFKVRFIEHYFIYLFCALVII